MALLSRSKKNKNTEQTPPDEMSEMFSSFEFEEDYGPRENPASLDIEKATKRGFEKLASGKTTTPDPEIMLALSTDSVLIEEAFSQMADSYLAVRKDKGEQKCALMRLMLGFLRAAHWMHWTSHWQVKGENSYGDHLLLERLYTGITEEIDTLAEKMVGEFGVQAVNPLEQAYFLLGFVNDVCSVETTPIRRAFVVEKTIQEALKVTYSKIKEIGNLSLGLDDYLMATANAHDTFLYLLSQRLSDK
jgi:hypothetical protein